MSKLLSQVNKRERTLNRFIITLLLLVYLPAINATEIEQGKLGTLKFYRWQTTSGANVLFAPSKQLPMLDIRLIFNAGSARDYPQKQGVSRLTNALIFDGSQNISATKLAQTFEHLGVQYGSSSYRDMAVLTFRTLSEEKIRKQTLQTISKLLNKPLFETSGVKREINNLRVALKLEKEKPSTIARLELFDQLYQTKTGKHPYAKRTNGNENSLKNIQSGDLHQFFKQFYNRCNLTLALVGDLSLDDAKKLAEDLSDALPTGNAAKPFEQVLQKTASKTVHIPFNSQQSSILLGQTLIKRGDPDYPALYLANHILGGSGFSSRLVKTLRVKHGLTYGVSSYFSPMQAEGPFMIGMNTKQQSTEQAIKLLHQTLKEFIQQGPTDEEIKLARQNISGSFPLSISSNRSISEQLAVIGFYQLPLSYLEDFLQQIKSLDKAHIKKIFAQRIKPEQMLTIIVGNQP